MTVLVTGSLAYDHVFDFPGKFAREIRITEDEKVNVSFFSPKSYTMFGGTAGNIAYNLALLDVPHSLVGVLGTTDGSNYLNHMLSNNVYNHVQLVHGDTAKCFLVTDAGGNQINAFCPGALATPYDRSKLDADKISLVIVSPNDPGEMNAWIRWAIDNKKPYIFDPGQMINAFDNEELVRAVDHASYIIVNDVEHELLSSRIQLEVLDSDKTVIITQGAEGSVVYFDGELLAKIEATKVEKVLDVTGAGDTYRAGVIWGILNQDLIAGCKLGSSLAAVKVKHLGGQNHKIGPNDL